jgi:hypothetical protein
MLGKQFRLTKLGMNHDTRMRPTFLLLKASVLHIKHRTKQHRTDDTHILKVDNNSASNKKVRILKNL